MRSRNASCEGVAWLGWGYQGRVACIVARVGGDEFVVVLRGTGHEQAQRRFTGLIGELQESTEAFPYDEPLGVHWGVATCASPADISRALAEADERMYAMKRRSPDV